IVKRALTYPVKLIAKNAGVNGSVVVEKVLSNDNPKYGYNVATRKYEDLMAAGIIDPIKDFGSRKDTVLCGVFDGHGPFGHLVAKSVSDSLPSKLCSQWEIEVKDDDSLKEVNIMVGRVNNPEDSTIDDG
ncbi:hypothetical protein KI387_037598, partial [Taxus chinensis]